MSLRVYSEFSQSKQLASSGSSLISTYGITFLTREQIVLFTLNVLPLTNNFHDVCLICLYNMQDTVRVRVLKRTSTFSISGSDLHKTGIKFQIQRGDGSLPTKTVV